ncbi:MAG TPA: alginate lyase family protein, partial [Pyrinomonadaceae bacterium]|nr:alginate lyase family protein [Pyrinomonadaceae bacterium]
ERHVRPDGVYFEQSSYYHRHTTDFYTHFLILSRANGEPVESQLEKKLTALLDHLMYITRPDGTAPLFGDDDGGRLLMLDERASNDFRAPLSTGAALFNRPDYKYVAGEVAEETLWLLGRDGLKAFDRLDAQPPAHDSFAFPDGGYYVMRDGWSREANYLLVDCGPHGSLSNAHAHADALAFDLAARGRTLLVDPGTYTYTGSAELRDYFRSSAAHNTLTVDGESSSVPAGPFSWKHVARASKHVWTSQQRFDYFEGSHDGYERLPAPARHTRSMLFIKGDYWIMLDRVASTGAHRYDLHFHFAEGAAPAVERDDGATALRERMEGASGLEIFAFGGEWHEENGWVSHCYRERTAAPVLIFSTEAAGVQEFVAFLIPRRALDARAQVRQVEATGGKAFEVLCEETRDLVLMGDGHLIETASLTSDFAWARARFARETSVLEELVLISGRRLSLNGLEIFNSSEHLNYLVARRMGDDLLVESETVRDLRLPLVDGEAQVANLR